MKFSRNGFTLVELLVVIAIIGILIGMMFPAVGAMREAARRSTCQNRLARLGVAMQTYESGHGSLPSGTTNPKGPIHNVPQGIELSWTVSLLPYLDEAGTFKQHRSGSGGILREKRPGPRPPHRSLGLSFASGGSPNRRARQQLCRLPS